jgi:hypothetical protein
MEAIQCQPASGVEKRGVKTVRRAVTQRQRLKSVGKVVAQGVGLVDLPVVKFRAIAQTETCQKIVLIERDCRGERLDARRAGFVRWMPMCLAFCEEATKNLHIDLEVLLKV